MLVFPREMLASQGIRLASGGLHLNHWHLEGPRKSSWGFVLASYGEHSHALPVGQCNWGTTAPLATWSQATKALKGDNQHLELDLEANQQQVHLTQHGCSMDNTREPRTALLQIVSKGSAM